MSTGSNGSSLAAMRKQGLDERGQPVSSYWKARIEAEENRVRIQELEEEVQLLRSQPTISLLAPQHEEELARLRAENEKLRNNPQVAELKSALQEMEAAKGVAATRFQGHLKELQEKAQELRKEIQEITRSRDFWKNEADTLSKSLKGLQTFEADLNERDIVPLGRIPSIRDFLLWMGVRLVEGRVLAVGDDSGIRLSIEVKNESLHRMTELSKGVKKSYKSVPLSDPLSSLVSIFLPYKSYSEYQTDPRILEVFRILGRPLTLL